MNTNGWLRRSSPLFLRSGGPQFTSEGYLRGPAPGKVITTESVTSLLIFPQQNMPFNNGAKHRGSFFLSYTLFCSLGIGAPVLLTWFGL